MAHGPYNSTTITEAKLDGLLSSYNTGIGNGVASAFLAETKINNKLFGGTPSSLKIPYQSESVVGGMSETMGSGSQLFLEYGSTGSDTLDFTTNGARSVIVLGKSDAMNFNDLGSSGDKGDIIVGSNVNQYIHVNQGANYVVAGSASSTLVGGIGADTLVGGGLSSIVAGSGAATLMGGATKASFDTLVGGAGSDSLSVAKGNNLIVAGSGTDTIDSGDIGSGGGQGGDSISLIAGGNAHVVIGAGAATDSVYFGGTTGDDSIKTSGNVDVLVQSTEVITGIDTKGGTTTLSFEDGQKLIYSGAGHVTVSFNGF